MAGFFERAKVEVLKNKIRVGRAEYKLSQADLAEKVGATRQTIALIEAEKHCPSTVLAIKIAQALGKTVEELFYITEE